MGILTPAVTIGAVALRKAGYKGKLSQMEYGGHYFMLIEGDIPYTPWIADAWSGKFYPFSEWENYLTGFKNKIIGEYPNFREIGIRILPSEMPGIIPIIIRPYD